MQDLPSGKPVVTDTTSSILDRAAEAAARATPEPLARRVRGLSDRMVAWLFIAPTIVLLLAINIFPLIWAIQLSFTNYRANRPNEAIKNIGLSNYPRILTDTDTWIAMQTTAHFVFWTIVLQTLIGFTLAYLIDRKFRGHAFWTTIILVPMMLSPAVVGNFWRFLYEPQIGLFTYVVSFFTGIPPTDILMLSNVTLAPWAIIIVDTWMWTPYVMLICLAGPALHPRLHLRGGRGRPRLQLAAVLVDHAADGAALHHARGALPRHRELQDVRHGEPADRRRAGLDDGGRLDHAEARSLREMAHRLSPRPSPSSCSSPSSGSPTSTSKC